MRASERKQVVGREDGEFLIARCPRDWNVSTPTSLWEEDTYADSLAYTLGQRITPKEVRRRTLTRSRAAAKRTVRAVTLSDRERTILHEREAKRSYEAIGHEHGITRERVRQILIRAQKVAAYRRAVRDAAPDNGGSLASETLGFDDASHG